MNNNNSPWLVLLGGVMFAIVSAANLSGDKAGASLWGVFIPADKQWLILIGALTLCVMSIYAIISRRRAKPRLDDEQKDIPQEVLDFLNKKDADAKQNEAGPYQAKLEHTHPAGQTSSPRGEDKEKPADKGEGKNA